MEFSADIGGQFHNSDKYKKQTEEYRQAFQYNWRHREKLD